MLRRLRALIVICALGLLLPVVSEQLADSRSTLAWLVDLGSHWQWLFVAGLGFSATLVVWVDRRWAVCLLLVPIPWLTASVQAPRLERGGAATFAIASVNVHLDNADPQPLVCWLSEERPDAAVIVEVSPDYAVSLKALAGYPFQSIVPDTGPFGMALVSRYPLLETKVMRDSEGIARIESQLQLPGRRIGLVAFHPMPPLSPQYHGARNDQLRTLARAAQAGDYPAILAGDINATPWSSAFSRLEQYGLRRASGLEPTWPVAGRGLVGIPIDHVLVTPHWRVVSHQRGPDIGSDHYPVLVRLALAE